MENKTIIGFAGRQRSGKTCISKYLEGARGATVVTVASALKELLCKILDCDMDTLNARKDDRTPIHSAFPYAMTSTWLSKSIDTIAHEIGVPTDVAKDVFQSFGHDATVRDMLQKIGTDIIRKHNPMWHVDRLAENINNADSGLVVIDDIRFPNEREAVEKLGGQVFFIIRPDLSVQVSQHSSETSLLWENFDNKHVIINYSTKEFLCEQFTELYDTNITLAGSCPILKCHYDDINATNDWFGPALTGLCHETDQTVRLVFESIKRHNGVFLFHSTDRDITNQIMKCLYKKPFRVDEDCHTFVVWNPMIIENFKMWL